MHYHHRGLDPAERERYGIVDSPVRLSVGLEGVEEIVADLVQGLNT